MGKRAGPNRAHTRHAGNRILGWALVALLLAAAPTLAAHSPVHGSGPAAHVGGGRLMLGPMTVQPRRAHIGQMVTISGTTRGTVQFLPPIVYLSSVRTQTFHVPGATGMCGPTQVQSLAFAVVHRGGQPSTSGRMVSAGTRWQVRFRVPRRMNHTVMINRPSRTIPTPAGVYYVEAIAGGIDGDCMVPLSPGGVVSVTTMTILP